jgi:50S ribosome-binding GTPase
MTTPELAQLAALSQVDDIIDRLSRWTAEETSWEPLRSCRALLRRVLGRVDSLRVRLEAPLVVATFGGTGTGKSTLVNALIGRECASTGRQRPTTTRPLLLVHPDTDLAALGFPTDEFDVSRVDAPLLQDIVLIDCPDPDTSENDAKGSNLQRLHQLVPHCDVLIYTSTQQKYRSGRVADELGLASNGCRLLFVQTHAELDQDIRDDWRRHLGAHYDVPEVFFVDSVKGLKEQLAGGRPSGDLARLQQVLTTQLSAAHRVQVRRANLLDLVHSAVEHCRAALRDYDPSLDQLEAALENQHARLVRSLAENLTRELKRSSALWERRLLASVTQLWGFSPFSSMLRLYNAMGGLIASLTLLRARSSAQIALVGAVQGFRWLRSRQQEQQAEGRLERLAVTSADDNILREAQVLISGYAKSSGFDSALVQSGSLQTLRKQALEVEEEFLADASRQIDQIIDGIVARDSGWLTRACYETLFAIYPLFVLVRVGKNFFYDSIIGNAQLIGTSFYISAGLFFILWSWLFVMSFCRRLRRHLSGEIEDLARSLAEQRITGEMFPSLAEACRQARLQRSRLESIAVSITDLRPERTGSLGSPRTAARRLVTA